MLSDRSQHQLGIFEGETKLLDPVRSGADSILARVTGPKAKCRDVRNTALSS
jgi:hypothetical protein